MEKSKTRPRPTFKVINTCLDLPPEEKQAVWERKCAEVTRILARHYEAGTLFKK
jgi:hypothetical protein